MSVIAATAGYTLEWSVKIAQRGLERERERTVGKKNKTDRRLKSNEVSPRCTK